MTTSRSGSTPRPWKTTVLAGMASYLDSGTIVTTGIALVLLAPTLSIGDGMLGVLSGLLTLGFAVGAVVGGRLGDRWGRRRVYSVTLLLFVIGAALLVVAPDTALVTAGIVILGLAIGADLPVSLALISEQAPDGRKGGMVLFTGILWSVGIVIPVLLSVFVAPLGALGARILYGQLLLVALVVLIARRGLGESAEWAAKAERDGASDGPLATADDGRIRFRELGRVFRPPILTAVLATGLYYSIWNIGANSFGQFGTFFFVHLAHATVQTASLLNLATFPLGIIAVLVFMRVVDGPARMIFFTIGTILNVLAFLAPLVLGFSVTAFTLLLFLFGIGAGLCGEAMYKVWSQELLPTLLRGSAQGLTLAVARVVAGLVAFGTPALASHDPGILFAVLAGCAAVSGAFGLFWVPRIPTAAQLEAEVERVEQVEPTAT